MFRVYVDRNQIHVNTTECAELEQLTFGTIESPLASDHARWHESGSQLKADRPMGIRDNDLTGSGRAKHVYASWRQGKVPSCKSRISKPHKGTDSPSTTAYESQKHSSVQLRKRSAISHLRSMTLSKRISVSSVKASTSYRRQLPFDRYSTDQPRLVRGSTGLRVPERPSTTSFSEGIGGSRLPPVTLEARLIPSYLDRTLSRVARGRRADQRSEFHETTPPDLKQSQTSRRKRQAFVNPESGRVNFHSASCRFPSFMVSRRRIKLKEATYVVRHYFPGS